MADVKLESEEMDENKFLVSILGLMSGTVEIDGEERELSADWTGGNYIKVRVGGIDDRALFDLNEMIEEGVDALLEADEEDGD